MMHEQGVWLGKPQIVVNMNVSWLKYASIWILERIPEALDLAEKMGASPQAVDARRIDHLKNVRHWFEQILSDDPEGNRVFFDVQRLHSRFKHLSEYRQLASELKSLYRDAHLRQPDSFPLPVDAVFGQQAAALT